jgi:hypothetical protein
MINGSDPKAGSFSPYVGLSVFRPIMANPTNEEYRTITGSDMKYTMKYDYIEYEGGKVFPVHILVENVETKRYDFIKFAVSNRPETSSKGSVRYMNELGSFAWGANKEAIAANEKMSWFSSRPFEAITQGMEPLYNLLQNNICYNSRDEVANWKADMESNGITAEVLFDQRDVTGLNAVLKWADKNDHSCVGLYSVRITQKDGKTYKNQFIEAGNSTKPLFFKSTREGDAHSVPEWAEESLKKLIKQTSEQGYALTSREYEVKFQKYTDSGTTAETVPVPSASFADSLV